MRPALSTFAACALAAVVFATTTEPDAAALHRPTPSATTAHPCLGAPLPRRLCADVRAVAPSIGVPRTWSRSADLAFILRHESSFDYCAVGGGHHDCVWRGENTSCGLFQRLPCHLATFRNHHAQMRDGLSYIKHRYGNPARACAFWRAHRWY